MSHIASRFLGSAGMGCSFFVCDFWGCKYWFSTRLQSSYYRNIDMAYSLAQNTGYFKKKNIKSWENSQKLVILLRDYSMYIVAELWTDRVALASKWLVLNCCCVVVCMSWYALEKVIFRCVFCNKLRSIGVCEQG